jgi:hypothetical protein
VCRVLLLVPRTAESVQCAAKGTNGIPHQQSKHAAVQWWLRHSVGTVHYTATLQMAWQCHCRRAWTQRAYSQATQYNCVLAWQDLAYDEYKTSDKNVTAIVAMSNYNTDPRFAAFKYGWAAYDCAIAYPYICQIPAASFQCQPPPSPPMPPPSPPVPPSPPAPPSCKLQHLALRTRLH